MKVKKVSINFEKISIDMILCPKTNLYLQSLYCSRCAYFNSKDKNYISCNYEKPHSTISSDHSKEELIKILSKIKKGKDNFCHQMESDKKNNDCSRNIEMLKKELFQVIKKRKTSMNI